MNKKTQYDSRIIVIDLDLLELDQLSIDDSIYIKKLLTELTANQNLIICTNNTYAIANKIKNKIGLKTGYLISDGGAVISSMANNEPLQIQSLDSDIVDQIWHTCVWNNLHFSINTRHQIYPYHLSYWLIKKYNANLNYLYDYSKNNLDTASEVNKRVKKRDSISLEIFFLEKTNEEKNQKINEFKKKIENLNCSLSKNTSSINIINKDSSKWAALEFIFNKFKLNLNNNLIYCGINQWDANIVEKAYFAITTPEFKSEIDLKKHPQIEILGWGANFWIKWFNDNSHLWHGNEEAILRKSLEQKKEQISIRKQNIKKYLHLDNGEKFKFWPDQIEIVQKILNKIKQANS